MPLYFLSCLSSLCLPFDFSTVWNLKIGYGLDIILCTFVGGFLCTFRAVFMIQYHRVSWCLWMVIFKIRGPYPVSKGGFGLLSMHEQFCGSICPFRYYDILPTSYISMRLACGDLWRKEQNNHKTMILLAESRLKS